MTDTETELRRIGLAQTMFPAEQLRHLDAIFRAIDPTGRLNPRAAKPYRTPLGFDWDPGSTARKRVKRAGRVATLAAECVTPPDIALGDATVTLTLKRPDGGGVETIATLTIPKGQDMADTTPGVDVPAGGWLGASVTTANGAGGVSISVTLDLGGA